MLTEEFGRRVTEPRPVVHRRIQKQIILRRVLNPEEERMEKRREYEAIQAEKTEEVKRLIASGMSRADANRQVFG